MVTIKDVAKLAGISKSTVSRVLNDGYASTGTCKKVKQAVKELNYMPNSFAKNIKTGRSNMIALMIPDLTNVFYSEIFKVVETVAWTYGYLVLLCDTNRSVKTEIMYATQLMACNVDGILYFAQEKTKENTEFFYDLAKKIPMVFMNRAFAENEDISYASIEGITCTIEAVEFLYNKGKRRIAYVDLPRQVNVDKERYESYQKGLELCGLPFNRELVVQRGVDAKSDLIEEGFWCAEYLMEKDIQIDAIMAPADQLAVGIIKYLRKAKIAIPEQVSVIGFDDIDLCTVVEPTLATIRQPIKEIATDATNILLAKIQGRPIQNGRIDYKGTFIKRESV